MALRVAVLQLVGQCRKLSWLWYSFDVGVSKLFVVIGLKVGFEEVGRRSYLKQV